MNPPSLWFCEETNQLGIWYPDGHFELETHLTEVSFGEEICTIYKETSWIKYRFYKDQKIPDGFEKVCDLT